MIVMKLFQQDDLFTVIEAISLIEFHNLSLHFISKEIKSDSVDDRRLDWFRHTF